jgi:hypothetical protein
LNYSEKDEEVLTVLKPREAAKTLGDIWEIVSRMLIGLLDIRKECRRIES